jgi:uncharacterized protein (DUF2235 family)
MGKNIVLLSDGTGNSAAKLFRTNVWATYQALDLGDGNQVAFYDDGVGSSAIKPWALVTGAVGYGLARNVRQLYANLCHIYEPGDRIYCFGFSRGAFTIRILTGLIGQGIVHGAEPDELHAIVKAAYRELRSKFGSRKEAFVRRMIERFRPTFDETKLKKRYPHVSILKDPKIEFVGLWDTVAAYGLPFEGLTRVWDTLIWPLSFPDRDPCSAIVKGCHALSIDDERRTFHPVMWNEDKFPQNASSLTTDDEKITQVWFAGAHSDLGGGYPDDSLAYVSLDWMMREAEKMGLKFKARERDQAKAGANPRAAIHDSRTGPSAFYRYGPRSISRLCDDRREYGFKRWLWGRQGGGSVIIQRPKIHTSVLEHIASSKCTYAPAALPSRFAVVGDQGMIRPVHYARDAAMSAVWDRIWLRELAVFSSLILLTLVAIWPLLPESWRPFDADQCPGSLACRLSPPLSWIDARLDILGTGIAGYYAAHPLHLTIITAVILLLYLASGKLRQSVARMMRKVWLARLGKAPRPKLKALRPIQFLRKNRALRKTVLMANGLVSSAIIALVAFAIVQAAWSYIGRSATACTFDESTPVTSDCT